MHYGLAAKFVKFAFAPIAFRYLAKELSDLEMKTYRRAVAKEYKEMIGRTPNIGSLKENSLVMALYAACFFLAIYKGNRDKITDQVMTGLIHEVGTSRLMQRSKKGKSPFQKKAMQRLARESKWSQDHIEQYPMNWCYQFEPIAGKEEYYVTYKQCAICKLAQMEGCAEAAKFLCMMDYYTYELQGAVLDRTKTLAYGDDECNFHIMSPERAKKIGYVKSPEAK